MTSFLTKPLVGEDGIAAETVRAVLDGNVGGLHDELRDTHEFTDAVLRAAADHVDSARTSKTEIRSSHEGEGRTPRPDRLRAERQRR